MLNPPFPKNEVERLAALESYDILDTGEEQVFDDLTRVAAAVCSTPIALVSLIDSGRQWFKSRVGLDATETPRKFAFCAHAILRPDEVLIVPDSSQDPRFRDNPLATGAPHVRFYAGAPLVNGQGLPMGTLCVIDNEPRELSEEQIETLKVLARQAVAQLELRRMNSALLQMTQDLQRSNEDLQVFTRTAAHDLKAPLTRLMAFSELIQDDLEVGHEENLREDLSRIARSSRQMHQMVQSLLLLSRAESAEIETEEVSLEECVWKALEVLSPRVEETGVRIDVEPLPTVLGNRTMLGQLFQNLIGNALKFTGESSPWVQVTCERDEERCVVGVKDNGPGMDPEFAERAFEPFQRAPSTSHREGSGVGLSICQRVVERHDGRLWVETEPGRGCHFRFELPLHVPAGSS